MNIIGISGLAGAGKSEAAKALVAHQGFVEIALADPIKRSAAAWFEWSTSRLWGPSENRNEPDPAFGGLSARKACQLIGTEVGRSLYADVWIECALRSAQHVLGPMPSNMIGFVPGYSPQQGCSFSAGRERASGVVVPDCRFVNEVNAIHAAGGRVIRIVRASAGLSGAAASHASETEQAGIPDSAFDGVIYNDGTIEDLAAAIGAFVQARKLDGAA